MARKIFAYLFGLVFIFLLASITMQAFILFDDHYNLTHYPPTDDSPIICRVITEAKGKRSFWGIQETGYRGPIPEFETTSKCYVAEESCFKKKLVDGKYRSVYDHTAFFDEKKNLVDVTDKMVSMMEDVADELPYVFTSCAMFQVNSATFLVIEADLHISQLTVLYRYQQGKLLRYATWENEHVVAITI